MAFTKIPDAFKMLAGTREPGTRIYRREGTNEEMVQWFDALCEHIGPTVSPGGAASYARVTRAGVHKRLKSGNLTAFCFHIRGKWTNFLGREKQYKRLALVYIPVKECQEWRIELESRQHPLDAEARIAAEEALGDESSEDGSFLEVDPKDKGKRGVHYVDEIEAAKLEAKKGRREGKK